MGAGAATQHSHSHEALFDMWLRVPLLAHRRFFLISGLFFFFFPPKFLHVYIMVKQTETEVLVSQIYIGNFTSTGQFYYISDNCRFSLCLGPMHII